MNDPDSARQQPQPSLAESQSDPVRVLADRLVPHFYDELKRLAHRERVRVGAGGTMQTTVLVNEAYMKLRSAAGWNDDEHFLRAAAIAMRHVLVNHAQARLAAKRGAGATHVSLTSAPELADQDDEQLVRLHDALEELAREAPRLALVVECRYFAGYDDVATAKALNLSERTVRRDWVLARAWLNRALNVPAV